MSEELPKHDTFFTATVAKTVDTLRNLLNNDPRKLSQHILVNEQPVDAYLLKGWSWNEGRYGVQRSLREMIDVLNKVRPHVLSFPIFNLTDDCVIGNDIHRQCDEVEIEQLQSRQGCLGPVATEEDVCISLLLPTALSNHRRRGNLSVRSLVDVVRQEHFINDSEYLQTVLVAVPK